MITFTDAMTFHWNGDDIHVFHVAPAHTDGDAIIHFKEANAVHMGDTYFNGFYPFIDVSTDGGIDGMIAAADKVLAMIDDETKIIPGHGPLSNKAELMAYRDMLVTVREEKTQFEPFDIVYDDIAVGCPIRAELGRTDEPVTVIDVIDGGAQLLQIPLTQLQLEPVR